MRIIERRDITDKYIVFCGMILTCILIWVVYYYFR